MGDTMNYESEYTEEQKQEVNNYLKDRTIIGIEFREEDVEIILDDGSLIEGEIDIDFILTEIQEDNALIKIAKQRKRI
jgi:hypothetical protein